MHKNVKKMSFVALALITLTLTTGCGDNAGRVAGDTVGFSREVITVGGDKFDCTFENRGSQVATMSCLDLAIEAIPGESDDKGFSRELITISGDTQDCIFFARGSQVATMDCFPIS